MDEIERQTLEAIRSALRQVRQHGHGQVVIEVADGRPRLVITGFSDLLPRLMVRPERVEREALAVQPDNGRPGPS